MKKIELGAIHISDWTPKEVILLPNKQYTLVIDYPLSVKFKKTFKTGANGWTRLKFVDFVCKCYKKIYKEEDKSTKTKPGYIPGMLNRNQTNGKYGIWGHDLGDLVLVNASLDTKNNNITLGVDS